MQARAGTTEEIAAAPPGRLAAAVRKPRRGAMWAGIRRQRLGVSGALIVGVMAVLAMIGPYIAPYDPTEQFISDRLKEPNGTYWLGTDEFGRDILTRLLHGTRISFQVGVIAVGLAGSIGVV